MNLRPFGKQVQAVKAAQAVTEAQLSAAKERGPKDPAVDNQEETLQDDGQQQIVDGTPSTDEPQPEDVSTDEFDSLFDEPSDEPGAANERQFKQTALLTAHALRVAEGILAQVRSGILPRSLVEASKNDHDKTDELIDESGLLTDDDDFSYLEGTSTKDYEGMIRSQQSKRSRSKSKGTNKLDNYKDMLVGAIAENILRGKSGMSKKSGGGANRELGYTDEEIAKLTADSELLKKEIRNVQSKKSITKSKAGFSEADDRWIQLLADEKLLKAIRDGQTAILGPEAQRALQVNEEVLGIVEALTDDSPVDEVRTALAAVKSMLLTK